jgi:hypothetical protein
METTRIDAPKQALTDIETINQLLPLLNAGIKILAINQSENLVLLKSLSGKLEAYSYCVSHASKLTDYGWEPKLEHYFRGVTHHSTRDFQQLFRKAPVGALAYFKSDTDLLYVSVTRVGKRRRMIDEIGNLFVKASGQYWKFPEQVDY